MYYYLQMIYLNHLYMKYVLLIIISAVIILITTMILLKDTNSPIKK